MTDIQERTDEEEYAEEQSAEEQAYNMLACVSLIRHLYDGLGQGAGGPLHVVVDDYNVDDHFVQTGQWENYAYLFDGSYERWQQAGEPNDLDFKQKLMVTCEAICLGLSTMPEAWRRVTVILASSVEKGTAFFAHSQTRELMESVKPFVYAHLKEKYGLDAPPLLQ